MIKGGYIALSTGHVKEEDFALLEGLTGREEIGWSVGNYEEGAFVSFTQDDTEDFFNDVEAYGFSAPFVDVLKFAVKNNCHLVQFDCDADKYSELEIFDW